MTIRGMAASLVNRAEDDQRAADYFYSADERSHHLGKRNADLRESPCAQSVRKRELLDTFGQEDHKADKETDEDR